MKLVRLFEELCKSDIRIAGGKGASLGEMTQAGIPVPPGFVITAAAFEGFLEEADLKQKLDTILHSVNHQEVHTVEAASEKIKELIVGAKMPEDIEKEIEIHFKRLGVKYVAVRSSATTEDSSSAAWAGQLDTFLNTTEEQLLENVRKCWASLFASRAILYRFEKRVHGQKISVAVIIQKMVESEISGAAFSVHPVTEDYDQLIIEAGFGLGEAVVSGQITPDSYVVEKAPRRIIHKNISTQNRMLIRANKHIVGSDSTSEWIDIPEPKASSQVLSDDQILKLSELALKIEDCYRSPQDIEWAFEKGKFYIVQSRPITTFSKKGYLTKRGRHTLYWEDVEETLLYAELDDYAWKLPEKIFGYQKKSSIYIYHNHKLAAFYDSDDSAREAEIGHAFYAIPENVDRVIGMKKEIAEKVATHVLAQQDTDPEKQDDGTLYGILIQTVDLYAEALSVHYLTQPQFFEKFEERGVGMHGTKLNELAEARLKYTRNAWTNAMRLSRRFLAEFALRNNLLPEQAEQLTYEELHDKRMDRDMLSQRVEKFVLLSDMHNIRIISGPEVEDYIRKYEDYSGITSVKGVIGNIGKAEGEAFVVKNENLNLKNLPKGMRKGMILIVQNAWPEFQPYFQMASAIVTNEGGITSHGVIVARELGIPCIVGTKIATHIFKTLNII